MRFEAHIRAARHCGGDQIARRLSAQQKPVNGKRGIDGWLRDSAGAAGGELCASTYAEFFRL